jgi:hypothetical protein
MHFVTNFHSNLLIRKCGGPSKPPIRTRKEIYAHEMPNNQTILIHGIPTSHMQSTNSTI